MTIALSPYKAEHVTHALVPSSIHDCIHYLVDIDTLAT